MNKLMKTCALILAAAVVWSVAGCGAPAQIGADPETFKMVDALYTAVSLHDSGKVDQCMTALKNLHEAGKLDQAPLDSLQAIVVETASGAWESAQSHLADFMRGQTRGRG